MLSVLHASYDGILQPLGYSQVVRPSLGLAARGFRVSLLTLEREGDLVRAEAMQRDLAAAGVAWTHGTFVPGGSPVRYAQNTAALLTHLPRSRPDLAWIRGFPAAPVGLALRALGVPFVYDIRGYWVDHRAAIDAWPAPAVTAARALESLYYRASSAAVSLTALGAADIERGRFAPWPAQKPATVIPTCVDYDAFTLAPPPPKDRLVVGFVGSVNADYRVDESLQLFALLAKKRPDAQLLCVSAQYEELKRRALAAGVPSTQLRARSAAHHEMPALLREIDWGLLLLNTNDTKRGSMPTKLGEFFAAGVRPIHHGCNSELGEWIARAGTGISLPALDAQNLTAAAARIATAPPDRAAVEKARAIAESHFSLRAGVDRYAALFSRLAVR